MSSENDNAPDDFPLENFTLESILAEYKGSAYINGDKKTPTELLNEQTDKILKEIAGIEEPDLSFLPDEEQSSDQTQQDEPIVDQQIPVDAADAKAALADPYQPEHRIIFDVPDAKADSEDAHLPITGINFDDPEATMQAEEPGSTKREILFDVPDTAAPQTIKPEPDPTGIKAETLPSGKDKEEMDQVILFFDNYRAPTSETKDSVAQDVERAVEKEIFSDEKVEAKKKSPEMFIYGDDEQENLSMGEDEVFEEPDLKDAVGRFAEAYSSVSLRCIPAALITIIMVIITFAFEAGMVIPFGIGRVQALATGTLVFALLLVMTLCIDIVIRGAGYLIRGSPNAETLILFSCVFSLVSAVFSMLTSMAGILPYCAVSALSLTFAALGERMNLRAFTETLKTAAGSGEPYGVQAEYNNDIDKSILKKTYNRTDGFYNNLMHPDISETVYQIAAPILLGAALILAILTALMGGKGEHFLHVLSALLAAAAPFSALLSFSFPFEMVVRSIRKSGTALAGWGGADDVYNTDGACVTDDDLFPPGTLSLNGLKLYEGTSPEKAIRYTASLIIASGSGLSHVFSEVLRTQGMKKVRVEDFACYEGGVGALIRGERVATGSAAFMNLIGLRIPDDMNLKNAIFTAVDNSLVAMFAVDYSPINSVQSALISILKWRIKLFFAVRDFNITPLMLEQKFRVSLENVEYIQTRDSYSISDSNSGREGRMAAILTREGLGPFAHAITGGKLLKSVAFIATVISVVSAALGVLIMFYMCWSGAFLSAKPGNLLLFMLSMLLAVMVVCGYARVRK